MSYKICSECSKNKSIENYYRDYTITRKIGYRSKCKECCQKLQKKRKPNEKLILLNKKCQNCKKILPIGNFYKNTRYKDGYFARCKPCHNHKEKTGYIIKRTKEYMDQYNKKKYKDSRYIIRSSIRKSLNFYAKKHKKNNSSSKYLGCTYSFFRNWIQYQFDDKMTWENHGTYWHFDHVKPCASFDLTDIQEVLKCYNWKNYMPLQATINLDKSDSIIPEIIDTHRKAAKDFLNKISSAPTLKNQVN